MNKLIKKLENEDWFEKFIEILKTRKKPDNFEEIKDRLFYAVDTEFRRRIKNPPSKEEVNKRRKEGKLGHQFKNKVFKRDGLKCFNCGKIFKKREGNLEIGHILPVAIFPEFTFEEWNGLVKCKKCHKKENGHLIQLRSIKKSIEEGDKLFKSLNKIGINVTVTEDVLRNRDWYESMVDDCRSAIVEGGFTARWAMVETYHFIGQRILEESEKFKEFKISKSQQIKFIAMSLGRSKRTVYRAIQFAKKYPDLSLLPEGKNTSWHRICNKYLPEPKKEDCQHENTTKITLVRCTDCHLLLDKKKQYL